MSPATWPRSDAAHERLLRIDARAGTFTDLRFGELASQLRPGDLVVVNDSATLPSSFTGRTSAGAPIELRLLARREDRTFDAILFGAGDWRTRTEDRPAPPPIASGETIELTPRDDSAARLRVVIESKLLGSDRLVRARFEGEEELWPALYRFGRPIQYAYLDGPLELFHVQTLFASRPWSFEMPSAGRPITGDTLLDFARRGVRVATLTHAAGISSTGDAALDAWLPLPERFSIPEDTARAVAHARVEGHRVVAIGTTVARALEGCAALHDGRVVAGEGTTDLVLRAGHRPRVVDGLLTGMHEPSASHFRLLEAFVPPMLLRAANDHAESAGYLAHEFGDSTLVLAS